MPEKNTVTVRIEAIQTVSYSQQHEIDREDWENLQAENSDEAYEQLANHYLDPHDVYYTESVLEDVEITKV